MAEVHRRQNESLEDMLKRFRRECAKDGIYAEIKKRRYYVPPSVRKKTKRSRE